MDHPVFGKSFSPKQLDVLRLAFDQAWAEVEASTITKDHESARRALAETIMHLNCQGIMQVDMLRVCGVRLFLRERCANDASIIPPKSRRHD